MSSNDNENKESKVNKVISPYVNFKPYRKHAPIDTSFPSKYNFILIESLDELKEVIERNVQNVRMSFDVETNHSLDYEEGHIVGFSFAYDGITGYYVPIRHVGYNNNISPESALGLIHKEILRKSLVYMYNMRFDCAMMEYENWSEDYACCRNPNDWYGYDLSKANIFDPQMFAYLCDPDVFSMISLKNFARHFLGIEMQEFSDVTKGAKFHLTDPRKSTFYAASDAIITFKAGRMMESVYKECGTSGQLDNTSIPIIGRCEREKTKIDTKALLHLADRIDAEIDNAETEIYEFLGMPVNLNSPKQLQGIFLKYNIDTGYRTETGAMAVGSRVVDLLPDSTINKYPFLKKYVKFKKLGKLRSSYITNLLESYEKGMNFARSPYNLVKTATGRLSSGNSSKVQIDYWTRGLNIQNLPKIGTMLYHIIDLKDRSLFKQDIISETPILITMGYQLLPSIKGKEEEWEELKEKYKDIIPNNDYEYLGLTESAETYNNIRAMYISDNPDEEDNYLYNIKTETREVKSLYARQKTKLADNSIKFVCDVEVGDQFESGKVLEIEKVHTPWVWMSCDYSGEEMRIITNMAKEQSWIKTFQEGGDLHKTTGLALVNNDESKYNKSIRKLAKGFNFGIAYGKGAQGFIGEEVNGKILDAAGATRMLNQYKKAIPSVVKWQERIVKTMLETATAKSYFGRPRRFTSRLESGHKSSAIREAKNHVVQSTGADVLKLAFIRLEKSGIIPYNRDIRFLNCVHDEMNFAIRFLSEEDLASKITQIQELMKLELKEWAVPLVTDASIGNSFGTQLEIKVVDGKIVPKLEKKK